MFLLPLNFRDYNLINNLLLLINPTNTIHVSNALKKNQSILKLDHGNDCNNFVNIYTKDH